MIRHAQYQSLIDLFKRINHLDHAITILNWDQMVMMPENGVSARSEAIAELTVMRHELLTSQDVKQHLDEASRLTDSLNAGEQRSLNAMRIAYNDVSCLPADLVKAQVMAGALCEHGWRTQRKANDWKGFLKNFKEVVKLSIEEANIRQEVIGSSTPYDALLDLHCRGDSSSLIDDVFSQLKAQLPSLIDAAIEKQAANNTKSSNNEVHSSSVGQYPISEQKVLSEKLMKSLGFDFSAGRLDISAHPFSTGVIGDQRITTRYDDAGFLDALLATAHETGHASYEAGLPIEWAGLPVGEARNMCIHESQSLLFEKMVTVSGPFLKHLHSLIQHTLSAGKSMSYESLLSHARQVSKSYIRVEADELTYPIHVALRYDIERDLINGAITPEDIPDAWDAAMQSGLGLSTKDNYTDGCMQDIHWTDGTFGYFPSYTMGAVNSAQLFQALTAQHSDWEDRFAVGDIGFVREWLSTHIWQHGCHKGSQELMIEATGKGTDAQSLIQHLTARYLEH